MRRGLFLLALAALPLFGVYTYYASDTFSSINTTNWQQNGTLSSGSSGLYTSNANGGSVISKQAVPDGTASYEVRTDLNLSTAGATYVHYLRASSDALSAPSGAAGSYVAVELQNPQWTTSGYVATVVISQRVGGVISTLATALVGCRMNMTMQSVITDSRYLYVYLDGVLATSPLQISASLTSGKPGVGTRNGSATASISQVDLGPSDRTAPPVMPLSSVATWPMPTNVDMQWDGAPDDANGTGVVMYQITKNSTALAYTRAGLYTDASVSASTTYSYTIAAMDRHGNWGPAVTVPVTTPAASTGESRRLGVKATGSYWGAAGENIDMFSGNLNFTLPLINPTRRDGSKLTLSLHYNSQNWRSDSNGTWNMGRDIGYGYGWMFTAGYIRASYSDYWTIHHYTFVDSTGAEYRLDNNDSGIWRSREGIYVGFDPGNNQLIFPDGSFWYFFCASRGDEPDSGTLYPSAFYDRNGNYIIASYASGIGTNLTESSGRISWISDVRASTSYGKSYEFLYSGTGIPHLSQINNNVGLGEEYALTYSSSQALKSPYSPFAQFATVDLLTGVNITNLGVSHVFEYGSNQAGELTKVTFPYGGVVEWAYTNFLFGNGKTFREVNSRKLTSLPGGTQLTYGIAPTDTGTPAFAHDARTVSDANGRDTRIYTFDKVATSASYGASTAFEQRDTSLTNQVLLHRDDTWTTDTKGNVYLNSSTTTLDPASSGVPKVSKVEIDRDAWGNVTEQRLFDYGLTTPTLKRKYRNTYSYGLGWVGINNLLVKSEIIEGTTTVQTATYDYDTGPAGSCPANSTNLTDVTDMIEHDARYSTSLTWRGNMTYVSVLGKAPVCLSYNIGGTVVKSQTVGGIAVDYSVTSASHYTMPSTVTPNGESNLASSNQFNSFLGLSSTTAPNSATAAFTYDAMTRPATTTSPHGAVTNYSYTNRSGTTLATSTATTNGKWVRTTVDGLGRTVKVERGNGSTVVSTVDTEYGPCACSAVGKVKRVSQPYAPGGTVYWTQYEYDARGRTTKVTPPLNAGYTTYLYVGNTVKVTDPAGRYKIHTVDVMGNLTKVSEKNPAGGADLDTFYTYNMVDKLTQVSMTRGSTTQLRTFGYDSAFRLETETKPETGTTTYTYDSMGRLSTRVDAKSQKVEYVYDAYGRVTMVKRYPVASGAEDVNQRTTNTYDYDGSGSSTRNIWGRLAAVSIPGAVTEHYSYTAAGLLTSKASDYGGTFYMTPTVDYSYDNEGKVTQMVYPQHGRQNTPTTYDIFPRLTLNYGYDAMGQLQKITSGSGPGVDLVNSGTYNAAGQLLSSMRASAVSVGSSTDLPTAASLGLETFQYNGRNQLTEQTGLGADLNYWYSATANDGRLAQKHDWVTGEEENYTYDSLGRLATAYTTGTQWGLSFVYDGFGNRLQQNVTKGTAPSTVQTVDPLTNRLNGAGFGYDLNGNMTGWSTPSGSVTASYDIENRMTQIVTPSVTETYAYGPGNLRVKKYQGGAWTYTVYGQGGEVLGTYSVCTVSGAPFLCQAKLRVYFGGRLVLSGWSGVTADRLGSPQGVHGRVYPYGEVSGSVSVDQDETFTTYKRDVSTGLDYARHRYYASFWGRFISADPYAKSAVPASPLSWNRFTYTLNDPINGSDPSGLNRQGESGPGSCSDIEDNEDEYLACLFSMEQGGGGGGGGEWSDGGWSDAGLTFSITGTCPPNCGDSPLPPLAQAVLGQVYDTTAMLTTPQFWAGAATASAALGAGGFALASVAGWTSPEVAVIGAGGTVAAQSPEGQSAIAGLLPAAENGAQWIGEVTSSVTESASTMYRIWGGRSEQVGAWVTPQLPTSAVTAASSYSLPPGNTAAFVSEVLVPAGTRIQTGIAAPLFGQSGGGVQVLLLEYLPHANFGPGIPFP